MISEGLFNQFDDVHILDGIRTPQVDYNAAFADANPIDLGIKAARSVLERTGIAASEVDSVLAGNMAPGGFDQFYVPRHIGLYAGVPVQVPSLMVQRICGTGFELFRQADDPAATISMIQTAESLAQRYGISRAEVDAFASQSFTRAVAAQQAGWFDGEIVPVRSEVFELDGYRPRGLRLARKTEVADHDTHPRPTSVEVLGKLRTVFPNGVQTGGNSSALTDAAAAAVVVSGSVASAWRQRSGRVPLGRLAAAAVVGVPPEIMGIGPAPAIRLLLKRTGMALGDIARIEVNEAQGAQTLAVQRELGIDDDRLNVHGGAIALGHPLAATGVRLTITVARQLKDRCALGHRLRVCRWWAGHCAADRERRRMLKRDAPPRACQRDETCPTAGRLSARGQDQEIKVEGDTMNRLIECGVPQS